MFMHLLTQFVYLFFLHWSENVSESDNLWDISSLGGYIPFYICYPESIFFPATKVASLQEHLEILKVL